MRLSAFMVKVRWIVSILYEFIWFFFFSLLICGNPLIDFWILNQPYIPGINFTCLWCIILFFILQELLINALFEDFYVQVCDRHWSVGFFFCPVFGFSISIILISVTELGSVLSSSIFWKRLCRWYFFLLMFSRILQWNHLGLEISFWKLLIMASISAVVK